MQKSEAQIPKPGPLLPTALLLAVVVTLSVVPPAFAERLPSVCLNHRLFGWCPGCGSLRALVRFFHGDVAGAARFNLNVLVTAPLLVLLLLDGLRRAARAGRRSQESGGEPRRAKRSATASL
jgi:hypothetical protein